jgi:hypothetical protein
MKRLADLLRLIGIALVAAALLDQLRRPAEQRTWQGNVLFFPYDFRMPNAERLKMRWWNPADPRVLTPHAFGVGWSVNLYQLRRKVQSLVS